MRAVGGLSREGAERLPALLGALDRLADQGRPTPCMTDPAPFVSDDQAERRMAAYSCTACPVVSECAAFADANAEPAQVWGGRDRTQRPYQRKASA